MVHVGKKKKTGGHQNEGGCSDSDAPEACYSESLIPEIGFNASDCTESDLTAGGGKSLDIETIYLAMLTTRNAVTPVDELYTAFLMQDVDVNKQQLKDQFVVVQRQVVKTPERYTWLYGCSCNPARQRMLDVLSAKLCHSLEADFDPPYQKCLHITTLEQLACDFDGSVRFTAEMEFDRERECYESDHSYEKCPPEITIYGIESSDHVLCVRTKESGKKPNFSIVCIDFRGQKPNLKCSRCKDQEKGCIHTNAIFTQQSDVSSRLLHLLNQKPEWRSKYVPVAVSESKIPFCIAPEEQKSNRKHLFDKRNEDGLIHLIPCGDGLCLCGSNWSTEEAIEDVYIFTPVDILPAKDCHLQALLPALLHLSQKRKEKPMIHVDTCT